MTQQEQNAYTKLMALVIQQGKSTKTILDQLTLIMKMKEAYAARKEVK